MGMIGAGIHQRLQGEIERVKPMKAKLPTHNSQLDMLKQERRNLLAEFSELRGQRIQDL
jgi:hypothetical protein